MCFFSTRSFFGFFWVDMALRVSLFDLSFTCFFPHKHSFLWAFCFFTNFNFLLFPVSCCCFCLFYSLIFLLNTLSDNFFLLLCSCSSMISIASWLVRHWPALPAILFLLTGLDLRASLIDCGKHQVASWITTSSKVFSF